MLKKHQNTFRNTLLSLLPCSLKALRVQVEKEMRDRRRAMVKHQAAKGSRAKKVSLTRFRPVYALV